MLTSSLLHISGSEIQATVLARNVLESDLQTHPTALFRNALPFSQYVASKATAAVILHLTWATSVEYVPFYLST